MPFWKNEHITPAQIIILGFFFLILGGAMLLTLPFATNGPAEPPFLTRSSPPPLPPVSQVWSYTTPRCTGPPLANWLFCF